MRKGKYICIEGPDYSGKTTAMNMLANKLKNYQIPVITTKHPGSTPVGQKFRDLIKNPAVKMDPYTRSIVLAADNHEFQATIAKPLASSDSWLLADRSNFVSSLAYQIADGIGLENLRLCHDVIPNPRKIDVLFVFMIDYENRIERKKAREKIEGESIEYYERDREHFMKLLTTYSRLMDYKNDLCKFVEHDDDYIPNVKFIDTSGDSPENVVDQMFECLNVPMI